MTPVQRAEREARVLASQPREVVGEAHSVDALKSRLSNLPENTPLATLVRTAKLRRHTWPRWR
ncbi:hypothetical protein [Streptomyces sp. NPDC058240]|uniref:hypothetical protein n=1 Tax=Streptomyces sp. NPDC058240 TaxID=3346396 RepID=UPI0036EE7790